MFGRLVALVAALGLLALPAAADASADVSTSGSISPEVTIGEPVHMVVPPAPVVVQPAPVVIVPPSQPPAIVISPAPPPMVGVEAPPIIAVQPVPPPLVILVEPPTGVPVETPPTVTVRPVEPAPVAAATSEAHETVRAAPEPEEEPEEPEDVDYLHLVASFHPFRQVSDLLLFGGHFMLRLLLGDELSFESRIGYLSSNEQAGMEVPLDFSLLWYPQKRLFSPFSWYLGGGVGTLLVHAWSDADLGTYPEDGLVTTRAVVGFEVRYSIPLDWLLMVEGAFSYRFDAITFRYWDFAFGIDIGVGLRI